MSEVVSGAWIPPGKDFNRCSGLFWSNCLERVKYPNSRSVSLLIGYRVVMTWDDVLAGFPILVESVFREGGKEDRRPQVTTRQEMLSLSLNISGDCPKPADARRTIPDSRMEGPT